MTALSILYVDDDADIRTIVRMALGLDPDITLTMAISAQDALSRVAAGLRPDVAVLDVMMPGMNGLMLMERLHSLPATANLPILFMTARARVADVAFYKAEGARGVIVKPFDPLRLAVDIRALLRDGKGAAED